MVASGDFECGGDTLDALFQERVAPLLAEMGNVLLIPHVRDVCSRHPCFPQEALLRSATALPKTVRLLPNPALFSLSEVNIGASSQDILLHLSKEEVIRQQSSNTLARLTQHVLRQRRFYPLFPGNASAQLDMGYAGLTEFGHSLMDIFITPSELHHFAKIVDGVVCINPGSLSKKAGSGTYAKVSIHPLVELENGSNTAIGAEEGYVPHRVWERTRVDIVRI